MALFDHETERQYLGAILADVAVLDRYPLPPEALHKPAHEAVLWAATSLHESKIVPNFVALQGELERASRMRIVGAVEDLWACALPPEAPVDAIRDRLVELHDLRTMRERLMRAVAACDEMDSDRALDLASQVTDAARVRSSLAPMTAAQMTISVVAALAASQGKPSALVPFGVTALDENLGGLVPGDLLVIGAGTNVGKSWTALTLALNAARSGKRAGIISLEDPPDLWSSRLMSILSGVSSSRIRRRDLYDADMLALERGALDARGIGVDVVAATDASIFDVVDCMRRLALDHGCKLIAVDYAQCLHGVQAPSDHAALRRMVGMLKSAAARLGVALMLTSQVRRVEKAAPDREPSMHELKESGDLENKAEYVVMLWRGKPLDDGRMSPDVNGRLAKSKVGGVGLQWMWRQLPSGALEETLTAPSSGLYDRALRGRS